MRERKLRSTAESLVRFRRSLITYTCYIYKIKRKVKSKNTMRICSPSVPRLKHEWNQTVWPVNNLRCGIAAFSFGPAEPRSLLGPPQVFLQFHFADLDDPPRRHRPSNLRHCREKEYSPDGSRSFSALTWPFSITNS